MSVSNYFDVTFHYPVFTLEGDVKAIKYYLDE